MSLIALIFKFGRQLGTLKKSKTKNQTEKEV